LTLLEALVAAVLLQLILLGVAPMLLQAIRLNNAAADLGMVVSAATTRLEQLRGTDYDSLTAAGSLTANVSSGGTNYFDASDPRYVVRWEISNGATADGGKRIAVRALVLRQVSGQPKEILLTTIRAGR
jgi:Tfp pilus assembly protein PilV